MDGKDESVYESFSDRLTPTSGCWENGARGQILEQKYTWPQRRLSQADVTAITSPKIEPAKVGIQRALSRSQNGCPEKHIDWARGGDGEWRLRKPDSRSDCFLRWVRRSSAIVRWWRRLR